MLRKVGRNKSEMWDTADLQLNRDNFIRYINWKKSSLDSHLRLSYDNIQIRYDDVLLRAYFLLQNTLFSRPF